MRIGVKVKVTDAQRSRLEAIAAEAGRRSRRFGAGNAGTWRRVWRVFFVTRRASRGTRRRPRRSLSLLLYLAVVKIQVLTGFVRSLESMEGLWTIPVGAFGRAAGPGMD